MRKLCVYFFLSILCGFTPAFLVADGTEADDAPKAVLKKGDIEHFIETYPKLVAEIEALGEDFDDIEDPTAAQALFANAKFQSILEKYKWEQESYVLKLSAITSGFAVVKIEAELAKLPEEQRAMMRSMLGAQMTQQFSVHPDDIAIVREHFDTLDAFFESL